jgi:predicted helicase
VRVILKPSFVNRDWIFLSRCLINNWKTGPGQRQIAFAFKEIICLALAWHLKFYPGKNKRGLFNQFLFEESLPRRPNIHPKIFNLFRQTAGFDPLPSPGHIFYYIYAVLFSTIYRETYVEHLRIDFPRVPFTSDYDLFNEVARLGQRLVEIHLMKSPELECTFSKFPVSGDSQVKTPLFKPITERDGRVYINDTQYFSNIPLELWEFEVCGYKVLYKWLLDRKKRKLTPVDIRHYIKICRAIQLTIQYREKIDGFYDQLEKNL